MTMTVSQSVAARQASDRVDVVALCVCAILLCILPFAYAAAYYKSFHLGRLNADYFNHLAVNWFCNAAVFGVACRARGGAGTRLAKVVYATFIAHGLLAFAILVGRDFFSRQMILTAGAVSAVVGLLVVAARSWFRSTSVAALEVTGDEVGRWLSTVADVVTDPSADLRSYEVVVVDLRAELSEDWTNAVARAMLAGCEIRHAAEYLEERRGRVSVDHFHLDHVAARSAIYQVGKRMLDVSVVVFFAPVALLVVALAALGTLLFMPGPVFFIQERVGLGGTPFRMWKLRTMRPLNAREPLRETTTADDRIPPYGALLRRLRIDELPQLWNVLVGEMSLVGPRPEAVTFHEAYVKRLPEYAFRNLVRPGITGWAQVSTGPSANVEEARNKLSYDLFYVKRLSLLLDLQVLARTFWTIAAGGGVR